MRRYESFSFAMLSLLLLTVTATTLMASQPPYPILLVHGINSNDAMWDQTGLAGALQHRFGFTIPTDPVVPANTLPVCLNLDGNESITNRTVVAFDESVGRYPDGNADIGTRFPQPLPGKSLPPYWLYRLTFDVTPNGDVDTGVNSQVVATSNLVPVDSVTVGITLGVNRLKFHVGEYLELEDSSNSRNALWASISSFVNGATYDTVLTIATASNSLPPTVNVRLNSWSNQESFVKQAIGVREAMRYIMAHTGADRVMIIAHSMGGLAVRTYLQWGRTSQTTPGTLWVDPAVPGGHHVAKLVTLGTPHCGSNVAAEWYSAFLTGSNPVNPFSNAARDLVYSYEGSYGTPSASDDGVVFRGGREDYASLVSKGFASTDITCDSTITVTGLNDFSVPSQANSLAPLPADCEYAWLVGNAFIPAGDGCVREDRQYLTSPGWHKVILATHSPDVAGAFGCYEAGAVDSVMEMLDEPDVASTAYDVNLDTDVAGFLTCKYTNENTNCLDSDYYRFTISAPGTVQMSVSGNLPSSAAAVVELRDASDNVISSSAAPAILNFRSTSATPATFFVRVGGLATQTPNGFGLSSACSVTGGQLSNPYILHVSSPVGGTFPLTLTKSGSGSGSVSSNPTGINGCTSTCTASFPYNSTVTLTASSSGSSTFTGWSGEGCLGTSTCQVQMTQARNVTATFVGPGGVAASANPNPVAVGLGSTITARVTNGQGSPAPVGTVVTFETTFPGFFSEGGNCYSPCTGLTDATGTATQRFTGNAGGAANITVSSAGATPAVVALTVQPQGSTIVTLTASWDSGSSTSTTYRLDAVVTSSSGSPQSGQRVDFSANSGALNPTYNFTGTNGQTTSRLTVTATGSVTAVATCNGAQAAVQINAQVGGGSGGTMGATHGLAMSSYTAYGVAFTPDGSTLIASNYQGWTASAWNTSNYASKWADQTVRSASQVSASPDGSNFLVASAYGMEIHRVSDGGLVCTATLPEVGMLGTWRSSTTLMSAGVNNAYLHSSTCASGSSFWSPSGGFQDQAHMECNIGKGLCAQGDRNGYLYVFTTSGTQLKKIVINSGAGVYDSVFSSDGSKLGVVSYGTVIVFDTSTWAGTSYSAPDPGGSGTSLTFLDNNTKLAVGGGGKIDVLDLTSGGTVFRKATFPGSGPYEMAWNQSTTELAAVGGTNSVSIYRPLDPIDTAGPVISVTSPVDGAVTTSTSLSTYGKVTDQSSVPTFTINGSSTSLDGTGNFSSTIPGLIEGTNTVTYSAADSLGNPSTVTRTITLVVDRAVPVVSNVSSTPTIAAPGTQFVISCSVIDGDTGVQSVTATVRNSGGTMVATQPLAGTAGSYSTTVNSTGFAIGAYIVDITAVDSSPQANSVTIAGAVSFTVAGPQSLTIIASGTGAGTVNSSPAGITCGATCTASFPYGTVVTLSAAAASTSAFSGWTGGACSGTGACQVVMSQPRQVAAAFAWTFPIAAPLNVIASGAGSGGVSVTWSPSANATVYEISRSAGGGGYVTVGTTASLAVFDATTTPATAYLYRVRVVAPASSAYSNGDLATTVAFTDADLSASRTMVKAAHITELRTAVNAVRTLAGLGPFAFSDPTLSPGSIVRAVHLTELRSALTAARSQLGLAAVTYAHPTITPGSTVIWAVDFMELRNALK